MHFLNFMYRLFFLTLKVSMMIVNASKYFQLFYAFVNCPFFYKKRGYFIFHGNIKLIKVLFTRKFRLISQSVGENFTLVLPYILILMLQWKHFLKFFVEYGHNIWDKVFKSGLSKFCGRQSLKNLKGYSLLKLMIYA